MIERSTPIDANVMNSMRVPVGPFVIPVNVRDFRILMLQIFSPDIVNAHLAVNDSVPSYKASVAVLRSRQDALESAEPTDYIDADTRYRAGTVIQLLAHEVEYQNAAKSVPPARKTFALSKLWSGLRLRTGAASL